MWVILSNGFFLPVWWTDCWSFHLHSSSSHVSEWWLDGLMQLPLSSYGYQGHRNNLIFSWESFPEKIIWINLSHLGGMLLSFLFCFTTCYFNIQKTLFTTNYVRLWQRCYKDFVYGHWHRKWDAQGVALPSSEKIRSLRLGISFWRIISLRLGI